jgi:phosphoglycerate kinase
MSAPQFRSLKNMNLEGKVVLLRADLNVPAQRGRVTDTTRIDRLKPTIDYLREKGAKTLILSHFGRPEGEQNPEMSLAFLITTLSQCWDTPVRFAPNCIGQPAQDLANALTNGDVGLLENLRFHKGETKNDPFFVSELAKLGDVFINDAFSAAHRSHASTAGLAAELPSAAGLLMEAELHALSDALESPKRPVMAIAGGSKISTKLSVLSNLIQKTDYLVLGGGMANTFIHAMGGHVGSSLCEKDMADQARSILESAKDNNCEIILPTDCVSVTEICPGADNETGPANSVPDGRMAIDIGPESIANIQSTMKDCKTILWNGPMGVFEIPPFDAGTNALARMASELTKSGDLISVAGGGDTVAALENANCSEGFTYVSSAGGAFLEWLEGKTLPGIAALEASLKKAA